MKRARVVGDVDEARAKMKMFLVRCTRPSSRTTKGVKGTANRPLSPSEMLIVWLIWSQCDQVSRR